MQAKCQIYTQPAAVVGFDIVGPLKTNVRGEEKYVLSIQCYMTRFVVFVAIPNRKADTVVRALGQHWIHRFGAPVVFVSDNAPEFTAIEEETIAHLEQKLGVAGQAGGVFPSSSSPNGHPGRPGKRAAGGGGRPGARGPGRGPTVVWAQPGCLGAFSSRAPPRSQSVDRSQL